MRIAPVFLLLLPGALLCSCEERTNVEIANEQGILILGNSGEPKGIDPHLVSGVLESNIISALFEGLTVAHPSEDSVALPGAAAEWTHNDDFTEWTFHLQPEGKWSDGVPVTAHDFVFAYQRLLNPALPAEYSEMLYFLRHAEILNRKMRSYALFRDVAGLGIRPEQLKSPPFQADNSADTEALGTRSLDSLTGQDRLTYVRSRGLDGLEPAELAMVARDPSLVAWPDDMPVAIREDLVRGLLDYAGKLADGTYQDLGDLAPLGATAIDDHTLRLSLRGPTPFLPEIAKHYTWFPLPRHVVLKHGTVAEPFTDWTDPGKIASNGAFQLKDWRINHHLEVERNPYYWDAKSVKLNGIRYLPTFNIYTEARMFLDGQMHLTYTLPPEMIVYAREHIPEMLRQEAYVGVRFLRVNTRNAPLDDPKVRHALAAALDRESIIENILQGGQKPAHGITPPFGDYQTPDRVRFDPELARRLLAESGYASTSAFPEIDYLTTDRDSARRMAEAVQAMWRKHLGINVRIIQREWTTYLQRQYDGDFDICASGWIGDYLDPTTFLEMWIKDGGNNNTGWGSDEYMTLLRKAENTIEPAQRLATLAEAETILLEALPVIPNYWYTTNYLIRPEVKGWHPLLLNHHPFKFVELTQ
jgi:oligopeptide transport system substrate-binding protein